MDSINDKMNPREIAPFHKEAKILKYELTQRFYFEAAHTLNRSIDAVGSQRIHGHTYYAEVSLTGSPRGDTGMVLDLGFFRIEIERVRSQLDHQFLDDVDGLGPATLENLCLYIRNQLLGTFPDLCAVMIERSASGDRCLLRW